jgi:Amiloride-sensitive sodium channel
MCAQQTKLLVNYSLTYSEAITLMATQLENNLSSETLNFVELLRPTAQLNWFEDMKSDWLLKYTTQYSMTLTRWGLCFTFNMLASHELLNLNETSRDFHFKVDIRNQLIKYWLDSDAHSENFNSSMPWHASHKGVGFFAFFNDSKYLVENPFVVKDGFLVIVHSNFEFPSTELENHFRVPKSSYVFVDLIPVVHSSTDSLGDLSAEE